MGKFASIFLQTSAGTMVNESYAPNSMDNVHSSLSHSHGSVASPKNRVNTVHISADHKKSLSSLKDGDSHGEHTLVSTTHHSGKVTSHLVTAHREGDHVHLTSMSGGHVASIKHSDL